MSNLKVKLYHVMSVVHYREPHGLKKERGDDWSHVKKTPRDTDSFTQLKKPLMSKHGHFELLKTQSRSTSSRHYRLETRKCVLNMLGEDLPSQSE